jgi:hypothetical protein
VNLYSKREFLIVNLGFLIVKLGFYGKFEGKSGFGGFAGRNLEVLGAFYIVYIVNLGF